MSNIEGMDELLATLSGLGIGARKAVQDGLHLSAKRIQGNAKLLCPVGKKREGKKTSKSDENQTPSGQLRNSIKTKSSITEDGARAEVYSNLDRATYVNFGTGARGAASEVEDPESGKLPYKANWKGQRAQPFMSSAYIYAKDNGTVEKDVVLSLQKQIKKQIKSLERGKK